MISKQTIARIIDTAQIEEVVSDFVTLKKRGASLIGLCPFHNEKTPSFYVSPSKGIYKCFGCGKAGNSINFVIEHEHFTYPEALEFLAKKYHIPIETTGNVEEEKAVELERDSLYIINTFAEEHFIHNLFETEEGKTIGLTYFKERGLRENTIRKFRLGYSINDSTDLLKASLQKGFKPEQLRRAGLVSQHDNRDIDFIRGRVMFTIHNLSGKVVAFAGRSLRKDDKGPKYINSPETDIYKKSHTLYGLFFAKNEIRKQDECFLTEGYLDVITMHQAGLENTVASSGTSLTYDQVRLLKRYTKNITLLYDGDAAGIKAALRGVELILEEDLNVKIAVLPEGNDPDSYLQKHTADEFREFITANAKNVILFKADVLLKNVSNDPVKKAEVIHDIAETVAKIPDPIKRSLFIHECSQLMQIEEQLLISTVNSLRRKKMQSETNTSEQESRHFNPGITSSHDQTKNIIKPSNDELQERDIIRVLINYGDKEISDTTIAAYLLKELDDIEFDNKLYQQVLNENKNHLANNESKDSKFYLNHPNPDIAKLARELLFEEYELSPNWEIMHNVSVKKPEVNYLLDIISSLNRLKHKKVQRMKKETETELKNEKDPEKVAELLKKYSLYQTWDVALGKDTGTVITH
jgi:DNA primase